MPTSAIAATSDCAEQFETFHHFKLACTVVTTRIGLPKLAIILIS